MDEGRVSVVVRGIDGFRRVYRFAYPGQAGGNMSDVRQSLVMATNLDWYPDAADTYWILTNPNKCATHRSTAQHLTAIDSRLVFAH